MPTPPPEQVPEVKTPSIETASAPTLKKPKGKIRRALAWSFKPFVNVTGWIGLNTISEGVSNIKLMGHDFLTPTAVTAREETFSEAVDRMQLTPEILAQKERDFLRLACIFGTFSVLILFYALYLAWTGLLFAFILALVVSCLAITYAFRFHFWWFQVKHRKLGCSIKEWSESQISSKPHRTSKKRGKQ